MALSTSSSSAFAANRRRSSACVASGGVVAKGRPKPSPIRLGGSLLEPVGSQAVDDPGMVAHVGSPISAGQRSIGVGRYHATRSTEPGAAASRRERASAGWRRSRSSGVVSRNRTPASTKLWPPDARYRRARCSPARADHHRRAPSPSGRLRSAECQRRGPLDERAHRRHAEPLAGFTPSRRRGPHRPWGARPAAGQRVERPLQCDRAPSAGGVVGGRRATCWTLRLREGPTHTAADGMEFVLSGAGPLVETPVLDPMDLRRYVLSEETEDVSHQIRRREEQNGQGD